METYRCRIRGEIAEVSVDLAARDSAPDPSRPTLVYLSFDLAQPVDGLATDDEAAAFAPIEAALGAAMPEIGARLVGTITTGGRRELYFYAPSAEGFANRAAQVLEGLDEQEFDLGAHEDPDWRHYFELLFPREGELVRSRSEIPEA